MNRVEIDLNGLNVRNSFSSQILRNVIIWAQNNKPFLRGMVAN